MWLPVLELSFLLTLCGMMAPPPEDRVVEKAYGFAALPALVFLLYGIGHSANPLKPEALGLFAAAAFALLGNTVWVLHQEEEIPKRLQGEARAEAFERLGRRLWYPLGVVSGVAMLASLLQRASATAAAQMARWGFPPL